MRSGHYNRGKADARRRASGKLRLCSVCCRAHCCGALGRGFCRWRTVRTQVFAAQLAGPVLPTVPAKRLRSYPRRTRPHKASLPPALPVGIFQNAYAKTCICAACFFAGRAIFRHCRTKMGAFAGQGEADGLCTVKSCAAGRKMQARKKPYLRFSFIRPEARPRKARFWEAPSAWR